MKQSGTISIRQVQIAWIGSGNLVAHPAVQWPELALPDRRAGDRGFAFGDHRDRRGLQPEDIAYFRAATSRRVPAS